jgi:hypothetical protein
VGDGGQELSTKKSVPCKGFVPASQLSPSMPYSDLLAWMSDRQPECKYQGMSYRLPVSAEDGLGGSVSTNVSTKGCVTMNDTGGGLVSLNAAQDRVRVYCLSSQARRRFRKQTAASEAAALSELLVHFRRVNAPAADIVRFLGLFGRGGGGAAVNSVGSCSPQQPYSSALRAAVLSETASRLLKAAPAPPAAAAAVTKSERATMYVFSSVFPLAQPSASD